MNNSNKMNKAKRFFFFIPMMLFGLSAISFVVMQLWNWLMPIIFKLPTITFIQAFGLFVLSKILFSSFNFANKRHGMTNYNSMSKEKMMSLSEEERQEMKRQWQQRCSR